MASCGEAAMKACSRRAPTRDEFRGDRAARARLVLAITGCPSRCASQSTVMRAMLSVTPPGGNGTITRTGFCGHCCARAWVAKTTAMKISARTGSV